MKELSIEEKARRYDEAIEVARKIKNGDPINVPDGTLIPIAIFPELKESEDERIRKAIITYLKQRRDRSSSIPAAIGSWITFLEKQGQKPVWSEEDKNMLKWVTGYLENKMLNAPMGEERTACKNAIAWFKKLKGEQKPTELAKGEDYGIDGLYAAVDILQNTLGKVEGYQSDDDILEHKCAISAVKKLYEKKPTAWSEEDESLCMQIEGLLNVCRTKSLLSFDLYKKMCDFLKSIKDRVQ